MIDFHTHILPRIDDGSRSVEESLALLREESRQGVTDVLLTPHYYADEYSPLEFLRRRDRAWKALAEHLRPEDPRLRLGAEVQYFEGMTAVEDLRHLRIAGTKLLLLEMPFCPWSERMVEDILKLNDRPDTQIVLAHIERYLSMQPSGIWRRLREYGVLNQCNVSFFIHWQTRLRAMHMVSTGKIDFLGSDCHNMKHRRPNWDALPEYARDRILTGSAYGSLQRTLAKTTVK